MKIKTKIIAFVISLLMLVGMIPFAVFAEESEASAQSKIVLDGVNITLGEEIAINYYLTLGELGEDEINSLTANFAYGEKNKTVRLADAEKTENGVKLTVGLNVLEMAETVTLTFVDAEGAQVEFNTASSETAISAYTYSVKQYVESILARKSSSDELKAAAKSLLTYAHFAETYFGGEVSTNFDDVMTETDKAIGDVEFTDFDFTIYGDADLLGEGKLVLDDFAKIRISLNVDSEPVVTSEDAELEVLNINGKYHVDICGITVSDFNKVYTLYINGSETKINLLSVASIVANDVEEYGDNFANLAKAIYVYYHSVNNFVAVKNTIVYNVNGGTLPTNAPTEYDPSTVTKLPEDVTKKNVEFSGWYTTEDLQVGTKVRSIPENYGDKVTLYARYHEVYVNDTYGRNVNVTSSSGYVRDTTGNAETTYATKTNSSFVRKDDNGKNYILWTMGTKNSGITVKMKETNTKQITDAYAASYDGCISYTIQLSLEPEKSCSNVNFRFDADTTSGSTKELNLLRVNENKVQLINGGDTSDTIHVATLKAGEITTLRFVIDLNNLEVRVYNYFKDTDTYEAKRENTDGTVTELVATIAIPSSVGTTSQDLINALNNSMLRLYDTKGSSALRIYGIKIETTDIFRS